MAQADRPFSWIVGLTPMGDNVLIPNSVRLILAEHGCRGKYSQESALSASDALEVPGLLAGARVFVFGGDVVRPSEEGFEYPFDMWSTNRREGEGVEEYRGRCLTESEAYIRRYRQSHGDGPWYVLVIGEGAGEYGR